MEIHIPGADELAGLTRILVLAGPTAVGKTELSLQLAEAVGAEIVGMDSVQIYRELDIGSAKATPDERARIPHHVIDLLAPDAEHNVGDYGEHAKAAIADIAARGKRAIVVGGTGLYLRVLVHGLLDAPEPDWDLRAEHDRVVAEHGVPHLHEELGRIDPELAERLHPNDLVRISRGLEIFAQTGRKLSELQREHQFKRPNFDALKIGLIRPREELYQRVNQRVDLMLEQGFVNEVRGLIERYGHEIKPMGALGYKQMVEHLVGGVSLEDAAERMKKATRRYVKQQIGWLRGEPGVRWARAPLLGGDGVVREDVVRAVRAFFEGARVQDLDLSWAEVDSYDP